MSNRVLVGAFIEIIVRRVRRQLLELLQKDRLFRRRDDFGIAAGDQVFHVDEAERFAALVVHFHHGIADELDVDIFKLDHDALGLKRRLFVAARRLADLGHRVRLTIVFEHFNAVDIEHIALDTRKADAVAVILEFEELIDGVRGVDVDRLHRRVVDIPAPIRDGSGCDLPRIDPRRSADPKLIVDIVCVGICPLGDQRLAGDFHRRPVEVSKLGRRHRRHRF